MGSKASTSETAPHRGEPSKLREEAKIWFPSGEKHQFGGRLQPSVAVIVGSEACSSKGEIDATTLVSIENPTRFPSVDHIEHPPLSYHPNPPRIFSMTFMTRPLLTSQIANLVGELFRQNPRWIEDEGHLQSVNLRPRRDTQNVVLIFDYKCFEDIHRSLQ